jgi:hypothetical protein
MKFLRHEYFADSRDHLLLFEKLDKKLEIEVHQRLFDKRIGPHKFHGMVEFSKWIFTQSSNFNFDGLFYLTDGAVTLSSRDVSGSENLSEFDMIDNEDVVSFKYGYKIDDDKIIISQFGCLHGSISGRRLLNEIKKISKMDQKPLRYTATGELVLSGAFEFAQAGGRLVRTPDAPQLFDAYLNL